jgi:hypothetical protein
MNWFQKGLIFFAVSFFFCLHMTRLLLCPFLFFVSIDSSSLKPWLGIFCVSRFSSAIRICSFLGLGLDLLGTAAYRKPLGSLPFLKSI